MKNWRLLDDLEYSHVWDKFYSVFQFSPSIERFPAIITTLQQLKIDIKEVYSSDKSFANLERLALQLFNAISKPGDRLYALDWQHDCYDFDPREEQERNEYNEWPIPIFPDGDYHIFLTKDFKNTWFGHPWEQTITLIGDDIVKNAGDIQLL